jgi:hypothetical protein
MSTQTELIVSPVIEEIDQQLQPFSLQRMSALRSGVPLQRLASSCAAARAIRLIQETPHLKAFFLDIAQMPNFVEQVSFPSPGEVVRVMAEAWTRGLIPGDSQYSVYGMGDKRPAKLYVKEMGYREYLKQFGATNIDIKAGYPMLRKEGSSPEVWECDGTAACEYNGTKYTIDLSGKWAVRLPAKRSRDGGDITDNIDGIRAKVKRRLAKDLYEKISGEISDEENDEEPAESAQAPPPKLERVTERPNNADRNFSEEVDQLAAIATPKERDFLEHFFAKIRDCQTVDELREEFANVNGSAKAETKNKINPRIVKLLTDYATQRADKLKAQQP